MYADEAERPRPRRRKARQRGQRQREELSSHHLEAPERRTPYTHAQRPNRSPLTVFRSLFVEPAAVKTQVVVEAFGFHIESVMEKSSGRGGQCPHPLRIFTQFTK